MPVRPGSVFDPEPTLGQRRMRIVLFALWVLVTAYLAWNHAVWRDEVRALNFALQGSSVAAMLRGLHGEGHPALWYLMLRGAHAVYASPRVLQVVAYLVAFAAMALLLLRSPFRLLVLALLVVGRFALSEYAVMSRNYGISMLLLFVLAWLYPRFRNRGIVLGALLFLLANSNAHSVLLVGAFLLFWLVDILPGGRAARTAALKTWMLNAGVAGIGIALCAVTITPTINDAAQTSHPAGLAMVSAMVQAIVLPDHSLDSLFGTGTLILWLAHKHLWHAPWSMLVLGVESLLVFGSTLGLIRRPAALIGALAGLVAFSLFFTLIYPGNFRHQALWLVFLISMYWIAGQGEHTSGALWVERTAKAGSLIFILLLVVQALNGLRQNAPMLLHRAPESRVRDLAALIASRPDLKDAVVVADPDYLVETLPYYASNPTYLMREQRFGHIVYFTRRAQLNLSLEDVLEQARALHAQTGSPVIILIEHDLNATAPESVPEGYDWELSTTPEQVRAFAVSTQLLAKFGPVAGGNNETFSAYLIP